MTPRDPRPPRKAREPQPQPQPRRHENTKKTGHQGDDGDEFAREMADVVPLRPDPRGRVRRIPVVNVPSPAKSSTRSPRESGDADLSAFAAPGVDRRTIRELKRGDHPAAARSDLHGLTAAEAAAQVRAFLANSRRQQHRCVCIVHGRGLHSIGNMAVLKTRVRELLRAESSVLAYADAPASDGGAGAVYVLLRR